MTKPESKELRTGAIYIRMTPAELARLDAISERLTFLSRSGLARVAILAGLDAIEARGLEAVAVSPAKQKKGRKP